MDRIVTLLTAAFVFFTYTEPHPVTGELRPCLLTQLVGGWADLEEFDDSAMLPVREELSIVKL